MVLAVNEEQYLFFVIQEESHPNMVSASNFFFGDFCKILLFIVFGFIWFWFVYKSVVSFSELWVRVYMIFVFAVILRKGVILQAYMV